MSRSAGAPAEGSLLRWGILALLALAPLLVGAVHEPVFVPLLLGCGLAGVLAWRRSRAAVLAGREPPLPGARWLVAALALVIFQLVPLPAPVLRLVNPGSYAFYDRLQLVPPLRGWHPISVSPPDTLRGLAFLAGFSLLYLAVFREMGAPPWPRRLLWTVAGTGLVMTLVAFAQAASSQPTRIYGLWKPRWDFAVFGPYVNRNHFAAYLVMATLVALGLALDALARLRERWQRRRRGYLALGESAGMAFVRAGALVMVLVAGLFAAGSRGAIGAFAAAALALPFFARHRGRTAAAVGALVALGVSWIGVSGFLSAWHRGVRGSRLDLWADMLPMLPRAPVFGIGWNAFPTAYGYYQTVWRSDWVGAAHNEYLQVLLDTGLVGAVVFGALLAITFRRASLTARRGAVELGLFGALLGLALDNLVDFNWQIPANAATFVALAGLACRPDGARERAPGASP